MINDKYYNEFFEIGQQKINFSFFKLNLPDDDPVYTLKKVLEDIDFSRLTARYSPKVRTGYNEFIDQRLTTDVLDDLHYQFVRRLEKEGHITLKELFIDGTKIEANANRYTFVWRGSINYHLAGLPDKTDALYNSYNKYVTENGFDEKYEIGEAVMFAIEGMDKVRETIEKNRQRKLTKHKKLSNNRRIEINNCSPLELLKLQENLLKIAEGEGIIFASGKGQRKSQLQKLYEELEECGRRLLQYKECFEIHNSYICEQ